MPPATPFKLGFVSVHVSDLEKARPFYEGFLGLRRTMEFEDEVFYDLGGVALSVHVDVDGHCGRLPGGPTGFYLRVPDVEKAREDVRRAGQRIAWDGGNSFSVEDPDGNEIVFWKPRTA